MSQGTAVFNSNTVHEVGKSFWNTWSVLSYVSLY